MKTCLITGGCGFIGRHFTKRMYNEGYDVTVIDNMMSKSALFPDKWPHHLQSNFTFVEADIVSFLLQCQKQYDIIIHAAAIVGGRETIENDPLLISYNTTIDTQLFRWIEKNPPKHLVYFSSSAAYPIHLQTFENHRVLCHSDLDIHSNQQSIPDLTYGWSKLTGEYLLSILSKRVSTNISIYRPFSGYGEDQHDSYPFISIMKKVMKNEDHIEIWSDAVRDFVYIDDIVDYVLKTCLHNNGIQTLNIGTGIATSMSVLANIFSKIMFNNTKEIKIVDDKPKGVYYRVYEKNSDYPWTSLEEGIIKCIKLHVKE